MTIDQQSFGKNPFEMVKKPEGADVVIDLKIIRHGERDGKFLNDLGRERTKENAVNSGIDKDEYDAVKAIGSNADPNLVVEKNMGRALETADIYAKEIAGDEKFNTRANKILNYENIVSPKPYNHVAVYNSFLPGNFKDLSPEEKAQASKIAQAKTLEHVVSLDTPEAENYKREMAGSYAYLIDHYQKMTARLKSDSKVLIPAGTHGGMMEFILRYALVRKNDNGEKLVGFKDFKEIGGEFNPSEAFNIRIRTDQNGGKLPLIVTFDNQNRQQDGEMYLDQDKVDELKRFYLSLHQE